LDVRFPGGGEHFGRFNPEHDSGVLGHAEYAITDVEMPRAGVLCFVGVGQSL
jgi:hypothetical protein